MRNLFILFFTIIHIEIYSQEFDNYYDEQEYNYQLKADSINEILSIIDLSEIEILRISDFESLINHKHEITEYLMKNAIDELNYPLLDYYIEICIKFNDFDTYLSSAIFHLDRYNDWNNEFRNLFYNQNKYDRYTNENLRSLITTTENLNYLDTLLQIALSRNLHVYPSRNMLYNIAKNAQLNSAKTFLHKSNKHYHPTDMNFLDFFVSMRLMAIDFPNQIDSLTTTQTRELENITSVIQAGFSPDKTSAFQVNNLTNLEKNRIILYLYIENGMKENEKYWYDFMTHLSNSLCEGFNFELNGYTVYTETEIESINELMPVLNEMKEMNHLTNEEYCTILKNGIVNCENKSKISSIISTNCN